LLPHAASATNDTPNDTIDTMARIRMDRVYTGIAARRAFFH
jgi:hypothetical protein